MVAASQSDRLTGVTAGRAPRRRWNRVVRRLRESDLVPALLLCVTSALIGVIQHALVLVPLTALVIPMYFASLVARARGTLPWFIAARHGRGRPHGRVATAPGLPRATGPGGDHADRAGGLLILVRRSAAAASVSPGRGARRCWSTCATGSTARRGSGLAERGTPRRSCAPPGYPFAGDFMSPPVPAPGRSLHVVPGRRLRARAVEAGTRSLLLSGAFGGLLARPPARGLPAPRPTTSCCARTGARASPPRSTSTSTSTPASSNRAWPVTPDRAAARRVGPLGGARGRGPGAGTCRGGRSTVVRGRVAAATR